jgi:hypothetical protein
MTLQEEIQCILRLEKELPQMLLVNNVNYKVIITPLLFSGFRISYGEFDGNQFNWKNNPIDLFYEIVDASRIEHYTEYSIRSSSVYKTNIEDVITDCLDKLKEWHKDLYTELIEIIPEETKFYRELSELLSKYNKNIECNTPSIILAEYLINCLNAFTNAIDR